MQSRTTSILLSLLAVALLATVAWAAGPASPAGDDASLRLAKPQFEPIGANKSVGDPVDLSAALALGANYLRHAQADITEDNAGNGVGGSEVPKDPDDGGWDWVLTSPNFVHSTASSPLNLYGATAQGLLQAYLATGNAALATAMDDAAAAMIANASIRSASDYIFLMRYDDLPYVAGTTYADAARAKYDGRIATYGSATALAVSIRDSRGVSYPNGLIAWDVGAFAVAAAMLDARYPGNGYDADADAIAEVLWQDSFNDNPGLFDVEDDKGYDPTYTNVNFWMYNLGIAGLIDAFVASGNHTTSVPVLVARLLESQSPGGAINYQWGVHAGDEDWQSTAYAALSLAATDLPTHQRAINKMGYWISATQDASSGSWVYDGGDHYPEVGGECTAALSYALPPTDAIVDDDFTSQADVDTYNLAHATDFVFGYDAFNNIQDAANAVSASTVTVLPGLYVGNLDITLDGLNLIGPNVGIAGNGARLPEAILDGNAVSATIAVNANNVLIDGFTIKGGENGLQSGIWHNGTKNGTVVQNNIITDNSIGIYPQSNGPVLIKNNLFDANNRPGASGGAGIYVENSNGLTIQGNEFKNHSVNSPIIFATTGVATHVGMSFLNNSVHDNISGLFCLALSGATISGNTFASIPGGTGVTMGGGCSAVDVLSNTFSGMARGLRVADYYSVGVNSDVEAHQNNFGGCTEFALGVLGGYATPLDASCNWWSSLGGPNAAPSNPNVLGQVVNQSGGSVVFWPWLDGVGGNCVLYGDNNVSVGDAPACVTSPTACVSLPVTFNRLNTVPSRGVSVTIQLSPELVLCTGAPYTDISMATGAGTWSGITYTNLTHQIVDNGGGSYTIDRAILGTPCGPTNGGTLFFVNVKPAPSVTTEAIGTVTVTFVDVRDCSNAPLPGSPGAVGEVAINLTTPAALTGLSAVQKKLGNDSDGTTKINLSWTPPTGDADFITIYRKGFGDYPEYNDGAGATPAGPVTTGNGWTLVATEPATSTGYADQPPTRDFWYYAAYVSDECGNTSPVSALTGGTLNYHLGDVHNGVTAGAGDNLVNTSDMSNLGINYGITLTPYGDALNYLDVGPTTNYSVDARPTTDNRVQFEDLMMFAINHDQVSKIQWPSAPADANAISLVAETPGAVGSTFDVSVVMSGKGDIQGLSVPLAWNSAVAVPVDTRPGDLLPNQGDLALVLSPELGTVDAALMGVGDRGISGQGTLATVTFRVVSEGDPQLGLGNVTARDKANQPVVLNGGGNGLPPVSLPSISELRSNVPNPFNPSTEFSFVLSQNGPVTLRIYTMRGELVRTLLNQDMAAGPHALTWNGTNEQGRQVASGAYIVRFVAPDRTQSRHITLLK